MYLLILFCIDNLIPRAQVGRYILKFSLIRGWEVGQTVPVRGQEKGKRLKRQKVRAGKS